MVPGNRGGYPDSGRVVELIHLSDLNLALACAFDDCGGNRRLEAPGKTGGK